ncbi:MAG: hypothetical protein E7160_00210 [Firmicutes bacterium]|nr:hypothetical protein [Bacillota bacterium]
MSKESFKYFARNHSELADYIINGKTNWQKLYELYEIYGENSPVWNKYFPAANQKEEITSIPDLINTIKNVDLDSVQKGITNIQKTIGLLQEIGIGNKVTTPIYEPRPLFRYFED